MVKLATRMRALKTLRNVRIGPGATIIEPSSNITRLHLTFTKATRQEGNLAAHKLWRQFFPRVKYHNPGLGITVKQLQKETVPASLSVYFNKNSSEESKAPKETETTAVKDEYAPKPTSSEIVKTLNIKYNKAERFWQDLRQLMVAKDVEPTAADLKEVEEGRQFASKIEMVRKRNDAIEQVKKNREEMLNKAAEDVQRLQRR